MATQQMTGSWPIYSPVFNLAFSRDGRLLASGNLDDKAQLWDMATRQPIGNPLIGYSLAFSPDGKTLAAGSTDGTVQLWDVTTRQQAGAALNGHAGTVYSVAFSPDGKTLVSGSAHGTARLWDVSYLVGTAARLCDSVQRSLSRAEWTQYVSTGPAYRTVCP